MTDNEVHIIVRQDELDEYAALYSRDIERGLATKVVREKGKVTVFWKDDFKSVFEVGEAK